MARGDNSANSQESNNYRGIALLNTCYKILSLIILNRLESYTNGRIGEYQAGFKKNQSTIDQIFTLGQILEKRIDRKKAPMPYL